MHTQKNSSHSKRLLLTIIISSLTLFFHWLVLAFGLEQFHFFNPNTAESIDPHQPNPVVISMLVEASPRPLKSPTQQIKQAPHKSNHISTNSNLAVNETEPTEKQNSKNETIENGYNTNNAPKNSLNQHTTDPTTQIQSQNGQMLPHTNANHFITTPTIDQRKNIELLFHMYLGEAEGNALAQVIHSIQIDGNFYEISSTGQALGLLANLYNGFLNQKSIGQIGEEGLQPQLYTEQRGKKPEIRVLIDRNSGEVLFGANQTGPEVIPNLQDRLSVIYRLGRDIENFTAIAGIIHTGQQWQYPVVSSSAIETFVFEAIKPEVLTLADSSKVQTWHIRRVETGGNGKSSIDLWLDPTLAWLPVQIRFIDKKGLMITQQQVRSGNVMRKD
jgi:hypothetical protein